MRVGFPESQLRDRDLYAGRLLENARMLNAHGGGKEVALSRGKNVGCNDITTKALADSLVPRVRHHLCSVHGYIQSKATYQGKLPPCLLRHVSYCALFNPAPPNPIYHFHSTHQILNDLRSKFVKSVRNNLAVTT